MRWREAELTHGRVGMLASAGFLVQENFHPLFSADGDCATWAGLGYCASSRDFMLAHCLRSCGFVNCPP